MTNFEKIKAMTIEEFAKKFSSSKRGRREKNLSKQ